jgi:hypothetical protein
VALNFGICPFVIVPTFQLKSLRDVRIGQHD